MTNVIRMARRLQREMVEEFHKSNEAEDQGLFETTMYHKGRAEGIGWALQRLGFDLGMLSQISLHNEDK